MMLLTRNCHACGRDCIRPPLAPRARGIVKTWWIGVAEDRKIAANVEATTRDCRRRRTVGFCRPGALLISVRTAYSWRMTMTVVCASAQRWTWADEDVGVGLLCADRAGICAD
jgi:hypothetical protein